MKFKLFVLIILVIFGITLSATVKTVTEAEKSMVESKLEIAVNKAIIALQPVDNLSPFDSINTPAESNEQQKSGLINDKPNHILVEVDGNRKKKKKGKKGKREYIVKQCGKCLFQLDPLTQNALYKPVTGFFRACSMLDPA